MQRGMIHSRYQKKIRATSVNLWVSGDEVAQGDCLIEQNPIAVIAQLDNVPPFDMEFSVGTQKREFQLTSRNWAQSLRPSR